MNSMVKVKLVTGTYKLYANTKVTDLVNGLEVAVGEVGGHLTHTLLVLHVTLDKISGIRTMSVLL